VEAVTGKIPGIPPYKYNPEEGKTKGRKRKREARKEI